MTFDEILSVKDADAEDTDAEDDDTKLDQGRYFISDHFLKNRKIDI